jgi:antimicrobial peptide system SdpA family protein
MREIRVFSLVLLIFWGFIVGIVLFTTMPSPFTLRANVKGYSRNLIPEGWAFFTRNPREEMPDIYSYNRVDKTYSSHITPCASSTFLFGLARECRMIGGELGTLMGKVDDSLWLDGNHLESSTSFDEGIESVRITNDFANATFLGDYYLVKRQRIPWAWSKKHRTLVAKYKYVKVRIERN